MARLAYKQRSSAARRLEQCGEGLRVDSRQTSKPVTIWGSSPVEGGADVFFQMNPGPSIRNQSCCLGLWPARTTRLLWALQPYFEASSMKRGSYLWQPGSSVAQSRRWMTFEVETNTSRSPKDLHGHRSSWTRRQEPGLQSVRRLFLGPLPTADTSPRCGEPRGRMTRELSLRSK